MTTRKFPPRPLLKRAKTHPRWRRTPTEALHHMRYRILRRCEATQVRRMPEAQTEAPERRARWPSKSSRWLLSHSVCEPNGKVNHRNNGQCPPPFALPNHRTNYTYKSRQSSQAQAKHLDGMIERKSTRIHRMDVEVCTERRGDCGAQQAEKKRARTPIA